jgi:hypothetical protein
MRKEKASAIAIKSFALLVVLGTAYLGTAYQATAQDAMTPSTTTSYAKMAPIDQYLMADRDAEIALARSAAPESIARDAEVRFLDVTVSKRRSKAKTVSCVSSGVGGLPHRMLTFGIRKCGFPCV